jgi:hypothetical protein
MSILGVTNFNPEFKHKYSSLDDVVNICQNNHVKEQYQLKILLQKYEYLFDGKYPLTINTNRQTIHTRLHGS